MVMTTAFWEKMRRNRSSDEDVTYYHRVRYLASVSSHFNLPFSNMVTYLRTEEPGKDLDEIITFYRSKNKSFTLMIHDHNTTKNLEQIALEKGFTVGRTFSRMVAPVEVLISSDLKSPFQLEEFAIAEMERDNYLQTILVNFPDFFPTLEDARNMIKLRNNRFYEKDYLTLHSFAAYTEDDTPIATANLIYNTKQPKLAELGGASVLPEYQHQGIYSDLLHIRANHAKSRGITHLFIIADTSTSAPIVAKKGFQTVETFKDLIYKI